MLLHPWASTSRSIQDNVRLHIVTVCRDGGITKHTLKPRKRDCQLFSRHGRERLRRNPADADAALLYPTSILSSISRADIHEYPPR